MIVLLPVQVLDLAREPGHGLGVVLGVPGDGLVVAGLVLDGRQRPLDVTHRGINLLCEKQYYFFKLAFCLQKNEKLKEMFRQLKELFSQLSIEKVTFNFNQNHPI